MLKKELLQMRSLKATQKMMRLAENDTPAKIKREYWPGHVYEEEHRQYGLYLRCALQDNILKVAFFLPDAMRLGGRRPAYELYIDRENDRFITFDCANRKWLESKVDRINWPSSQYHCDEKWISDSDDNIIKQYLGAGSGYDGILSYQMNIREKELEARHRKETDQWDADLLQIPPVPKDWERWVSKVGIQENFIFYRYDKKGTHTGHCSFCDKEVPIKRPHYNKVGHCPCCRHKVVYKSIGKFGRLWTKDAYMYLIQRCKDGFVIREFMGQRFYSKETYQTPKLSIQEIRRAVYSPDAKPLRAYCWGRYKLHTLRWIPTGLCVPFRSYYYSDQSGRVYGKTIPSLSKLELSRTGLPEIAIGSVIDPEHYLAVFREIPLLEKLVKARLPRLAGECVSDYHEFQQRFGASKATSLTGIMGIDQQELKRLRAQNGGLRFLDWLRYEKAAKTQVPDDVVAWFCAEKITVNDLKFIHGKMSLTQIRNYIRRQMSETGMTSGEVLNTWADYLSMAKRFGMDTDDAIIYRVRKLKKRHDELARRGAGKPVVLRAGKLLLQFPHVEEIMQSVREKFEYTGKEYKIIAPTCVEDILLEGDTLHHCISNAERYWDRMEQRESYILFLRKLSDPDKPYYTLEVEPNGTVRQLRTYYDRQNEKDINAARSFLRTWQKVVAKRLNEEDRMLAKASKVLREQEFIQMRNDQVIIHTGDLAGKLLVDVLTADLMEAAA